MARVGIMLDRNIDYFRLSRQRKRRAYEIKAHGTSGIAARVNRKSCVGVNYIHTAEQESYEIINSWQQSFPIRHYAVSHQVLLIL
jgi:hypothetical protein